VDRNCSTGSLAAYVLFRERERWKFKSYKEGRRTPRGAHFLHRGGTCPASLALIFIIAERRVSMRRLIFYMAWSLIVLGPAFADVRILASPGGQAGTYLNFFSQLRKSGQRVVIDGPCLSACTLVLSTIPRNRICVTRRAILGFHAPLVVDKKSGRSFRSRDATRAVDASLTSALVRRCVHCAMPTPSAWHLPWRPVLTIAAPEQKRAVHDACRGAVWCLDVNKVVATVIPRPASWRGLEVLCH
jgi:hypothetical protein